MFFRILKEQVFGDSSLTSNTLWLLLDKGLRFFLNFFFTIYLIKKSTVVEVGQYYYVLAIVSVFSVVASLGIQDLIVKHFKSNKGQSFFLLKNYFKFLLISSIVSFILLVLFSFLLIKERIVFNFLLAQGLTIFIRPFEVVQFYLDSEVKSKHYLRPVGLIGVFLTILKIVALYNFQSLYPVIFLNVVEILLSGLVFIVIAHMYGLQDGTGPLSYDFFKRSLRESLPFFFMAVSTMLYVRIDTVMIEKFLGFQELGYYSASTKLSEIWYVVPMILSTSLFPRFLEKSKEGHLVFRIYFQFWLDIVVKLSLVVIIMYIIFADQLIYALYGDEFWKSGTALKIHIWSLLAVSFGVVSSKWYIINNMTIFLLYRALCGLVSNIFLNLFLIPSYGIVGAAISTVVSYMISDFLFDLVNRRTRQLFKFKIKAFQNLFVLR